MKCRTSVVLSSMFCMAGFSAGTAASAAVPAGYIDASTYGWNATDATAALQAAINTGQNVWVPNMGTPWVVTPINLTQSNQTIQFESGTVVAAKAGAFLGSSDSLFTAHNVSNVQMIGYGATLQMRKTDYTQSPYEAGEWRMGIQAYKVSNFQIKGLTIKDTGGDAIYISGSGGSDIDWSQNVLVQDVRLLNNYRQGISVISAKDLTIDNAVVHGTSGTWPMAGIDLEPNNINNVLQNITIKNSIFNNNSGPGLVIHVPDGNGDLPNVNSHISVAIENVTIFDNRQDGINLNKAMPHVTIKDSLLVENHFYGIQGVPLNLSAGGTPRNSVANSAFWSNDDGVRAGWTSLSSSLTNVQPLFYSTDPNSPYYMYLDPSVSSQIATGASDGGYMGARPVYGIPEPASLSLLGLGALALIRRRNV